MNFARWATRALDEDIPLIRELMMYDAACPVCNLLERDMHYCLERKLIPSPLHWSRQVEYPWALRQVNWNNHERCLDVGSAWSVLKYAIAYRCNRVDVLEPNEEYIRITQPSIDHFRNLFAKQELCIYQVHGDARCIPFRDNMYDHVFCISTMEHIPDNRLQAVQECIRVLKPGGKLIMTIDVNIGKPDTYRDFFFTYNDVGPLLKLLGIGVLENQPGDQMLAAQISPEVVLGVLLISYQKPY